MALDNIIKGSRRFGLSILAIAFAGGYTGHIYFNSVKHESTQVGHPPLAEKTAASSVDHECLTCKNCNQNGGNSPDALKSIIPPESETESAIAAFENWLQIYMANPDKKKLSEGKLLLQSRFQEMQDLITRNPKKALAASLSYEELSFLPEEWLSQLEQPFSDIVKFSVVPRCGIPDQTTDIILEFNNGQTAHGILWENLGGMQSSHSLPVSGIRLDQKVAVADSAGYIPRSIYEEELLHQIYPKLQSKEPSDLALRKRQTTVLLGGVLRRMDSDSLAEFEIYYRRFSTLPGPNSKEPMLSAMMSTNLDAWQWEEAYQQGVVLSEEWTSSPKSVYFVNAVFPDIPEPLVLLCDNKSLTSLPR